MMIHIKEHCKASYTLAFLALTFATESAADDHASEPDDDSAGFMIVGAASIPQYMGSDDYSTVPLVVAEWQTGTTNIQIEGLSAQAAFLHRHNWHYGLAINIDMGRDDSIDNPAVALTETIDPSLMAGPFAEYSESSLFLDGDEVALKLTAYADTSGVHDGVAATLGATYALPLMIPWRFEFELETTYVNARYMDTYFGVTEADALTSGLSRFNADSGFRDVTFAANIGLFFSPKWGLFTRLSASQMTADAKKSPITQSGDSNQYFAGPGIYYRF